MFQHRRRFFRRWAGLLSGAHFLPERGGGGWNPQHSFLQAVLLSAAQFAGQLLLYRLLSCTQFREAGVGIPRTVYGGRGCYRQHNFGAVCIAGQKKWLLSGAQFGLFSAGGRLLSTAHFGILSAFQTCPDRVVIQRTFPAVGLLSGAQFPNCRILAAVVIDGTFLKKSTVQRTAGIVIHGTIRFFRGRAVVIRRTIRKNPFFCGASCRGLLVCAQFALQGPGLLSTTQYKDFSAWVVIQRTFPRGRIFPSALLECRAHFSLFLFCARGCYTRHFLKIPQNFLCRHFPAKKLFYRCYAPHIVAFYTFLLECCAQHRCNTAHICVGIFDIAILLF